MQNIKQWVKLVLCVILMVMIWFLLIWFAVDKNTSSAFYITRIILAYHIAIRMIWGYIIGKVPLTAFHPEKEYYKMREWEASLYNKANVKSWKNKMPVFKPELWDIRTNSGIDIIRATCQAELDHVGNILLSLLTIFFSRKSSIQFVIIITAINASTFDLIFVMIQRYNRPRLMRIMVLRS